MSGVQITEYGPIIQAFCKKHNKKNGSKAFTLHHCYKELVGNEKWIRRNFETITKRSWISISMEADTRRMKIHTSGRMEKPLQKRGRTVE